MLLESKISNIIVVCTFLFLSACATVPIVKPVKYYAPRAYAQIVEYIPQNTIYIGTIKLVPRGDASVRSKRQKERVIKRLKKHAAEAGADFVLITDIQRSNKDYFLDWNYSDGYTIEAEMFRRINE